MKLFFLLIVITFNYSFCQGTDALFINEIPQILIKHQVYFQSAYEPIHEYAKLNPELFYYYIKYINAKFDSSSNDFFINNLNKIRTYYQYTYNCFLDSLKNHIKLAETEDKLKKFCASFLDENAIKIDKIPVLRLADNTEPNYRDYFVIKNFFNDSKMEYNPGEDYSTKRIISEKEILSQLIKMEDDPWNYSINDLNDILSYWYIFTDLNLTSNVLPELFIKKAEEYNKFINYYGKISAGFNLSYKSESIIIPGPSYTTTTFPEVNADFNIIIPSVSADYKLFLSKYITPIGYINLQLALGYSPFNKVLNFSDLLFRNTNVDKLSNRYEDFIFSERKTTITSIEYLSFSVSAPLFFITNNVSINGGAGIILTHISENSSYNFEYRKYQITLLGLRTLKSEKGNIQDNHSSDVNFSIYPLIFANYEFAKSVTCYTGITLLDPFLGLSYNF